MCDQVEQLCKSGLVCICKKGLSKWPETLALTQTQLRPKEYRKCSNFHLLVKRIQKMHEFPPFGWFSASFCGRENWAGTPWTHCRRLKDHIDQNGYGLQGSTHQVYRTSLFTCCFRNCCGLFPLKKTWEAWCVEEVFPPCIGQRSLVQFMEGTYFGLYTTSTKDLQRCFALQQYGNDASLPGRTAIASGEIHRSITPGFWFQCPLEMARTSLGIFLDWRRVVR